MDSSSPGASRAQPQGHATVLSSVSNLTNTVIGAGMVALPHAFARMGWLLGSALLLVCAATAGFGLHLIKQCTTRLGTHPRTFYDLTVDTLPRAAWWFDAVIFIKCYGVCVSYLLISSRLMPQVVLSFAHAAGTGRAGVPDVLMSPALWAVVFAAALAPLCFLRRLDSLRGVGYVNIAAVIYLVAIMAVYAAVPGLLKELPTGGDARAVVFSVDILRVFPVIVFAYTCAQNIIPVYNELADPSERTADTVVALSIGVSALVYLAVALLGYLSFGSFAPDNIVTMYPDTSLLVCFGKVSVILLTLTSYPLQLYPSRSSLHKVVYTESRAPAAAGAGAPAEADERQQLVDHSGGRGGSGGAGADDFPDARWNVMTTALILSTIVVSAVVDDLSLVLGLVGSFGSTAISFILPALLYMTLFPEESAHRRAAFALGVWGAVVMVLTVSVTLVRLFW